MPTTPASVVDDRNTADPVIPQGVHDLRDGSVAAHGYDGRSHDLVGPSRYCAGGVGFRPVSYRSTLTPRRARRGALRERGDGLQAKIKGPADLSADQALDLHLR
jgi:hypothetical protein